MVVRRVGVLSLGKVLGDLYALPGLIAGALFAVVSLVGAANSQASDAYAGLLFGDGSVIFMPIFPGIFGFVFGLRWALLYNGIGPLIGDIEIELEETRHLAPDINRERRGGH